MELLRTEDVASVVLFDLRLSESALETFSIALEYLLQTMNAVELHRLFNDEDRRDLETPEQTWEHVSQLQEQLATLVATYCRPEFLPQQFRKWRPDAAPEESNDESELEH